ncbi:hypothetical protein [uncultured Nostoc sp.]|uniref:hypothetical protein n=1 Tax=uncultured Nostoc sp. TaxID=340711 RepID=UPI00261806EF|nr:hypothetical protein [uncultured Nostoc sp.]
MSWTVSKSVKQAFCSILVALAFNLWLQRKAQTGDVKPKPRKASQQSSKITDWEKFRSFVKQHGDKTQSEMAQLWDEEISQRTISRALRILDIHVKKNIRI